MKKATTKKIKEAIKTDNIKKVKALEDSINAMDPIAARQCFQYAFKNQCVSVLQYFLHSKEHAWLYRFVQLQDDGKDFFSKMFFMHNKDNKLSVLMEDIRNQYPTMIKTFEQNSDAKVLEDISQQYPYMTVLSADTNHYFNSHQKHDDASESMMTPDQAANLVKGPGY